MCVGEAGAGVCGAAARAGIAAEGGEDAGKPAESVAEHAMGGESGGIGGGREGTGAVWKHESAEFVVPVDGLDRVFEGAVSISGGRREGREMKGRTWSLSWCMIRSIDRCSL